MKRNESPASDTGIRERYAALRAQVDRACDRAGRESSSVQIMAVSKQQPLEKVREALQAGIRIFGENRVQELVQKWPDAGQGEVDCLDSGVHRNAVHVSLIGHLQRNKASRVAGYIDRIESLDNERTVDALVPRYSGSRPLDALIQINTSGEQSKYGLPDEEKAVFGFMDHILQYDSIRPRGVMTIAPFVNDEQAIRQCFRTLYSWHERIASRYGLSDWDTVSMGMSGDFAIAIEEGSTEIRIGTQLFGPRTSGPG